LHVAVLRFAAATCSPRTIEIHQKGSFVMKSSAIVSAIAAASLTLGSFSAFAQGRTYDRNASNNPEIYNQTHPEDAGRRDLQGTPNWNSDNRRGYDRSYDRNNTPRSADRRDWERRADRDQQRFYYGARSPEFRRGGYIPYEYRSRQYYVNDWRGHHLSAPPRGYQWVQVGGDYVLIALATGIIANLILNQ
jgi:Ni/Co efflux regulator RcnB